MFQKFQNKNAPLNCFLVLCLTLSPLVSFPALAAETSFKKVTTQLDSGGEFFAYQNTAQWAEKLSQGLHSIQNLFLGIPDIQAKLGSPEQISATLDRFVKDSGLKDLNGIGMSAIRAEGVEEDLYRNKILFHHEAGHPEGALWNFFGKAPHASDGIKMAPSTTALLTFMDLDIAGLWATTRDTLLLTGIPEIKASLEGIPGLFQMFVGAPFDSFLASLGGTYGFILTLDETKKITIPMGPEKTLEIPDFSFSIILKVKDDLIFNLIAPFMEKMPNVVKVDEASLKMRTITLPLPIPIECKPTIVRVGDHLILSTTDTAVQELFAVGGGKKDGLTKTPEFLKLSKSLPKEGNHFLFVSETVGRLIYHLLESSTASNPEAPDSKQKADTLKALFNDQQKSCSYCVSQNTESGWLTTMSSTQPIGGMMIGWKPILGILSAVAIPAMVASREKSKLKTIKDNLNQLEMAKGQWATANQKQAGDPVTLEEIAPSLPGGVIPPSVDGEVYALNNIGTPASATLNKKLAENPVGAVLEADLPQETQTTESQTQESQSQDSQPEESQPQDSQPEQSQPEGENSQPSGFGSSGNGAN